MKASADDNFGLGYQGDYFRFPSAILPAIQPDSAPTAALEHVLPPSLPDYNTDLPAAGYSATAFYLIDQLECSGDPHLDPYLDPIGIPTIGVGFNLRVSGNLNLIMSQMGVHDSATRNLIRAAVDDSYADNTALRSTLNAIMANWAASHPGGRATFTINDVSEDITIYNGIVPRYESIVDGDIPGVPQSYERMALLSLVYNSPSTIGSKLEGAISAGDRAEAWYEIRYDTNGGTTDLSGRRYVEAQTFGVFHNKDATDKDDVNGQESLLAFRMANAHQTHIAQYDAAHAGAMVTANGNIVAIVGHVSDFDIGTVASLGQELQPALARLTFDYADPSNVAPDLQNALNYAALEHLDFSITTPNAAWVAADVNSDAGHAHVVNRAGMPAMNDLIFGSITATSNDSGADDLLKGGAGNDFFVGGNGSDNMQGGVGNDTVSYLGSPDPVAVDLSAGVVSGGFATGDTLSGIENVLGSNGDDTLISTTGTGSTNILYGASGNDTIIGGDQDLLVGGAGDDHLIVTGTVMKAAQVVGGPGNDVIDATAEAPLGGADVYFTLGDGHDTVMSNPDDEFEDPGTGVLQFVFSGVNHGGASFIWTDVTLLHHGEVYDLWRGDGHITLGGGSTIDIGVVYGHSDPFSNAHLTPQSPGDFLVFADGTYSVDQIWVH